MSTHKASKFKNISIFGNSNTLTTFLGSSTSNRTVIIPDATDTMTFNVAAQTLTNKTLTSTSNTVRATQLATIGGDVVISGASVPSIGQALIASSSATATWQTILPNTVLNYIALTNLNYITGTVTQSGTTITGVGTTFATNMVGGVVVWASGAYALISKFISTTSLTTIESQIVPSGSFTIYYGGLQSTNTSRVTSIGQLLVGCNISRPAWGINGIQISNLAYLCTDTTSSGTVASAMINSILGSTISANTSTTYTNGASFYIDNAPTAGTNVVLTNPYALSVGNGNSYFNGNVIIDNTSGPSTRTLKFNLLNNSANGMQITTDTGDFNWQGSRGNTLQMSAWHAIVLQGGRAMSGALTSIMGQNGTTNTQILNLNDSIILQLQPTAIGTADQLEFLNSSGVVQSVFNYAGWLGIGTTTVNAKHQISGSATAAAWGINGIQLRLDAATYTDTTSSGIVATNVINNTGIPTLAAVSITTYTNAITKYISGAPIASTNVTITNPWSLYVNSGNSRFGGNIAFSGTGTSDMTLTTNSSSAVTITIPPSTDTLVNLSGIQTLANKTLTASSNVILAYPKIGNVITVDNTYGNDSLGGLGGFPFKTITAALASSTSGNTVYVWSGTYTDSGFTIPTGVSLVTPDNQNAIIAPVTLTTTTTVCTISIGAQIMGFTFNITSATSGIIIIGINFPSTTTSTAQVNNCNINITSTATGAVTLYGVSATGTGIPTTAETYCLHLCQLNVKASTATSGVVYGMYLSGSTTAIVNNTSFVSTTGAGATGNGIVVNNASGILRLKNSKTHGTTQDYTQTVGIINLTHVDLTSGSVLCGNVSCSATAPTAGQALIATSSNAATWSNTVLPIAIIVDSKTSGSNGGVYGSNSVGWLTRTLNTITTNASFATLASNVITLIGGNYKIYVTSPFVNSNSFQIRLFNITTSTVDAFGQSSSANGSTVTGVSILNYYISLATSTNYRIDIISGNSNNNSTALGIATGQGSEIYTQVVIEKMG